ncbi:SIR2 family NAD-dependent protein deacylase, partial [Trichococcus sp.]|uniref:SIR2 family NAD-dependent protein deacylase n=1 Tax=Trichococcus sp. TaxID=1985464 RepID=UPI003C7DA953
MNDKERFADMIRKSKRIVAFTGAGISTESGIPDFRSAGGLFDRLSGRHFTGEETLSIGFLEAYPALFFRNYAEHFDFSQAFPNAGHRFFAALEQTGKEVTVVTQNIDNLHQTAGSSDVIELHGNGTRWRTFETAEPADAT